MDKSEQTQNDNKNASTIQEQKEKARAALEDWLKVCNSWCYDPEQNGWQNDEA